MVWRHCNFYSMTCVQELLPCPWLMLCAAKCIYIRDLDRPLQSARNVHESRQGHDIQWITPSLRPQHPLRKWLVKIILTCCWGIKAEGLVPLALPGPEPHKISCPHPSVLRGRNSPSRVHLYPFSWVLQPRNLAQPLTVEEHIFCTEFARLTKSTPDF